MNRPSGWKWRLGMLALFTSFCRVRARKSCQLRRSATCRRTGHTPPHAGSCALSSSVGEETGGRSLYWLNVPSSSFSLKFGSCAHALPQRRVNVQLAKEANRAADVSRRTEPRNECGTLWAQAAAVPKLRSEHATHSRTQRFGELPDVRTFECPGCGVSHFEEYAASHGPSNAPNCRNGGHAA